jgi:flagellar basal-body rod protein FlgF
VISQGNLRITRLNLAQFGSLSGLEKTGDGFFRNANNQQVLPAPNASVLQGSIEGSNVNPIIEITEMIEVSRAYERMSKLIDQSAELSRGAVQRLGKIN